LAGVSLIWLPGFWLSVDVGVPNQRVLNVTLFLLGCLTSVR